VIEIRQRAHQARWERVTNTPTFAVIGPDLGPEEHDGPSLAGGEAGVVRDTRLAELLRRQFRHVWRALRRFGVPEASADDAAQEVFIIASRKLDQLEPGRERQFLHAVALRVAANARRARQVRPESAESPTIERTVAQQPSPEALLDRKQARELLDSVLDAMTEDLRTAFVLFELEGYSGPEVAEMLEIPLGTATSRLRRAREAFQESVSKIRRSLKAAGDAR
jgi:RNA polymerase sigma-70 factor (ECF subfamily)